MGQLDIHRQRMKLVALYQDFLMNPILCNRSIQRLLLT